MALNTNDLTKFLQYAVSSFTPKKDTPADVPTDAALKTMLPSGGVGTATPSRIFKSLVRWTLVTNGNGDKNWPANWQDLSIEKLVPKII